MSECSSFEGEQGKLIFGTGGVVEEDLALTPSAIVGAEEGVMAEDIQESDSQKSHSFTVEGKLCGACAEGSLNQPF